MAPTVGTQCTSPPCTATIPRRRSRLTVSIERTSVPFHGKSSGSSPPRAAVNVSQRPSVEKVGTLAASPSGRLVSCRSVPAATLPTHRLPRRRKAITWRSRDRLKAPASPRAPGIGAGVPLAALTFHSRPLRPNRISSFEIQAKAPRSDCSRCGSTGKSVSATGRLPGVTTNRSCLPAASHRNATFVPSGDQAGLVGYLMSAMRSMVMLPFGGSAKAAAAVVSVTPTRQAMADVSLMVRTSRSGRSG